MSRRFPPDGSTRMIPLALTLIVLTGLAGSGSLRFRRRGLHRWLCRYLLETPRRRTPRPTDEVHLLLCVADHYEPKGGKAPPPLAAARVRYWVRQYPKQFGRFRDSDGRTPRHTFFYP